jgi:hypothetical protein
MGMRDIFLEIIWWPSGRPDQLRTPSCDLIIIAGMFISEGINDHSMSRFIKSTSINALMRVRPFFRVFFAGKKLTPFQVSKH